MTSYYRGATNIFYFIDRISFKFLLGILGKSIFKLYGSTHFDYDFTIGTLEICIRNGIEERIGNWILRMVYSLIILCG